MDISEAKKITRSLDLSEQAIQEVSALDFDHFGLSEMEMEMPEYEEGTPNDQLGKESGLDDAIGDDESDDMIDDFLNSVINLVAQDYEESSAVDAVTDAVSSLVDDGSIGDIPDSLSPDENKVHWVHNSLPKIKERLHAFGLEFDETELDHYDTFTNQG